MSAARCRACQGLLSHVFCDLGQSPVSNALLRPEDLTRNETLLPLRAMVCHACWLVQLEESPQASDHFHADYVYFSSFSQSWLAHAKTYVEAMTARFGLGPASRVMEIASNDGYLLQYFVALGIPCMGIEPTANTADAARNRGVPTRTEFFGTTTARTLAADGWRCDLVLGNNVLAHVPDLNDFVGGMPAVLKPQGVITLEFPHLLRLIEGVQFDTIYHEHFSYLSLIALQPIFRRARLRIFDVERLPTHGGSLRLFVCHEDAEHPTTQAVSILEAEEDGGGLRRTETYAGFSRKVEATRGALVDYLAQSRSQGRRVAAYGAAAKGTTLLNFCGIGPEMLPWIADRNPVKQGRWIPGVRIPVVSPARIHAERPEDILILPWNIRDEVMQQLASIRSWGGRFVVPVPSVEVMG